MTIDTGTYGAKVQSWRRANPRDLLKRTIEELAGSSRAALLEAFRDKVLAPEAEEYLDAVIEYWFSNNYHSLVENPYRPEAVARRKSAVAGVKEKISRHVRKQVLLLLDTMLPNGKTLAATTFGECAKLGGNLSLIASMGEPKQRVGEVLSDDELRNLQGA